MSQGLKKVVCGCAAGLLALGVCMNGAGTLNCKAESGLSAQGAQESVTASRRLNIGSVSKVYTVTAVMQLADQGKVDLDAPVTEYITDFSMADERYKKITVRMLMNHTSGLMGSVYGGIFRFDEADGEYHDSFLSILRKESLKYEPGAFNCYCNDGFTLLEILVERVSGMTFTQYLEENICKPLSLNATGTAWNTDANELVPVYVNGNVKMSSERGEACGAGGIMSTAREVCEFGSAFFYGNQVLLSENAKKEMAKNFGTGFYAESFGLGWDEVTKKDYESAGVTVLSKGGDTFYHNASLAVAPEEGISVAVLASGGGSGVDEELALALMDVALAAQGIEVEHPEKEKPE
ncbi:MAG: beta-lactamase family protein, partial [Lachnospiraceae bacterium]|nr:beta-lactamase family protein [Lachnospiraceae bacterium]